MKHLTKTFAAAGVLTLSLTGCAAGGDKTELEGGVSVVEKDKLTVCTHLPYEPFQYKEGGKIVGFDVDLMDLVAEELGVEQTIVNTPFETIETGQAMNTAKCDIAAAGMTITEERAKVIDFSNPYFNATQALLTKEGAGIDSLDSLKGKTLGVQVGTTGQEYAEKNAPEGVEIRVYEDLALELEAVRTGAVDAAINDNSVLYDFVAKNDGLEVPTEFDTGEQYGFGVAKGQSDELLEVVNDVLSKAIEDGTYEELFTTYFPDAEVPDNLS